MKKNRIVATALTGGPCAGKTDFTKKARKHFENKGFVCIVVDEAATKLMEFGIIPNKTIHNRKFQEQIIQLMIEIEDRFKKIAEHIENQDVVIICDRAILDNKAYIDVEEFAEICAELGYSEELIMRRYDVLIHLQTAAIGAEEFYSNKNNKTRSEDLDGARKLDAMVETFWQPHQNWKKFDNSVPYLQKLDDALSYMDEKVTELLQ